MATDPQARKKVFKAALALAGTTVKDWAAQQGVTPVHVHYVLSEARESERLNAEIDAFIAAHHAAPAAA